ncbi:MAG: HPr(Ser) kinase/phosphatase [bacterium]|nr:MAG: HPr(Ser) kinase/phosphatase [bacterium]
MISIAVRYLYEHIREDLDLEVLAGEGGMDRAIRIARIQKPGLALAGYLDQLHSERVQVLGQTEISYLETLEPELAALRMEQLCSTGVSCLIIAKGLSPPKILLELCDHHKVPLLRTQEVTSSLIPMVTTYLEDVLAPESKVHGSLVDVYGVGILIMGKSGIGKSECALGLVERGHRLVGDDVVVIRRKVPGVLFGSAEDLIRYHMEIRGLGIINIKDLFGVSSIRREKKIELAVELVEWLKDLEVDRLGLDEQTYSILGVDIPYLKIPVRPARDLTMIIEVAARNHLLRRMGYHAAVDLEREHREKIKNGTPVKGKPDLGSLE